MDVLPNSDATDVSWLLSLIPRWCRFLVTMIYRMDKQGEGKKTKNEMRKKIEIPIPYMQYGPLYTHVIIAVLGVLQT